MRKKILKKATGFFLALTIAVAMVAPAHVEAKSKTVYVNTLTKSYELDESDNQLKLTHIYKESYDKKGNCKSFTYEKYRDWNDSGEYFSKTPLETSTTKYTYNKKGLLTKVEESGAYASLVKITYDKKNNKKTQKTYEKKKLKLTTSYTYKNNKLKKWVTKSSDGTDYTETICYPNGVDKYTKCWNPKTKEKNYEFYYDKKGNITKSIGYQDGKVSYTFISKNTYKKGVLAKVEESSMDSDYTVVTEYYTSGYRKGRAKSHTSSFSDIKTTTTYEYTADKSGKNVAVEIEKNNEGVIVGKTEYTWKKINK